MLIIKRAAVREYARMPCIATSVRNGPALAHPRTRRNRHDHGRRAAPLLRREQSAHPGVHQTGRQPRAGRWLHLLHRERRACPRCAARWPTTTAACTTSRSTPRREIVVTASGVQALNLGIRCVLESGRRSHRAHPRVAQRTLQHHDGQRHRAAGPAPAGRTAATPWISTRSKPPSRRARACCSTPRPPIRWAGSPRDEEQQGLLDFARRHNLWLMADEVYDRLYYAGARTRRSRALHPAQGHPRRRRHGGPLLLQELLHDRVARWLAGGAPRPRREGHAAQRVHHFARAHLRAEGRRDRAGRGRAELGGCSQRLKAESRPLPGRPRAACPA